MKRNFVVADAVAVQVEGYYCDLHNNFDLISLDVGFAAKSLRMTFSPAEEFAAKQHVSSIALVFDQIKYLNVSPGILNSMVRDFSELGYKSPDDFDHDWLKNEGQVATNDHLFLRFAGDEFVRVYSNFASVFVKAAAAT